MRSEEGVREPFSHFWEEFLRPQSSWLLPDPLGTPAPSRVRGAALSLVSHFPMRASKSTTLGVCGGGVGWGGWEECIPTPQMTRAKGEEGRCWGSLSQPPPQVSQGGWRAGEGCWARLRGAQRCLISALPAGTELGGPCIPLWHFPEVTWARFGQR